MKELIQAEKKKRDYIQRTQPLLQAACFSGAYIFLTLILVYAANVGFPWVVLLTLFNVLLTLWLYFHKKQKVNLSARNVAEDYDEQHRGQGRFETYLGLRSTKHPLKELQEKEMKEYYQRQQLQSVSSGYPKLFLMALVLLGGIGVSWKESFENSRLAALASTEAEVEPIEESIPLTLDEELMVLEEEKEKEEASILTYSMLKLTSPDEEMESSAFDEVIWEAIAESSAGFDNLYLEVAINGVAQPAETMDEDLIGIKGKLEMEGSLYLDEYDLEPFDVISYTLSGKVVENGKQITVHSLPQFIRIRPERVDLGKTEKASQEEIEASAEQLAQNRMLLAEIYRYIQQELEIIRATTMVRSSQQIDPVSSKPLILSVAESQNGIAESMDEVINDFDNITPDIYDELVQASEYMGVATETLEKAAQESQKVEVDSQIGTSIVEENKALSRLVSSLKNVKKIIAGQMQCQSQQNGKEKTKDPFESLQKYKIEEEDIQNNAAQRMQELKKEQEELEEMMKNRNLDSSEGDRKEMSYRQNQLQEKLEDLIKSQDFDREILENLSQARENSKEAVEAILGSDQERAESQTSEGADRLEDALTQFREAAEASMEEAMSAAMRELAAAKRKAAESRDHNAGEEEMQKAMKRLEQEFDFQREKGTLENAQKIANLMKTLATKQACDNIGARGEKNGQIGQVGAEKSEDSKESGAGDKGSEGEKSDINERVEQMRELQKAIVQAENQGKSLEEQLRELENYLQQVERGNERSQRLQSADGSNSEEGTKSLGGEHERDPDLNEHIEDTEEWNERVDEYLMQYNGVLDQLYHRGQIDEEMLMRYRNPLGEYEELILYRNGGRRVDVPLRAELNLEELIQMVRRDPDVRNYEKQRVSEEYEEEVMDYFDYLTGAGNESETSKE